MKATSDIELIGIANHFENDNIVAKMKKLFLNLKA
jgi:hypothetical protein